MNISLTRLQRFYGHMRAELLLHALILREFPGTVGLLAECSMTSLLLLALASQINPGLPVLLAGDEQEKSYLRGAIAKLGFTALHSPASGPLASALESLGWLAVIARSHEPQKPESIYLDENGVFRINPLAGWSKEAQENEMIKRYLPLPPEPLRERFYAMPAQTADAAADTHDWNL